MKEGWLLGAAVLTITSGALTAVSGVPLLYLPPGNLRDQNFMPVTGQTMVFFALEFVVLGLVVAIMGCLFLAASRWRIVWGVVISALSVNSLLVSVLGSTGIVVIASLMGLIGGLLGFLSGALKTVRSQVSSFWENWLGAFPFVLVGVGLWEFGGIFFGCGPPNGIGAGACELLGPGFYVISLVGLSAVLAAVATPAWKALRHSSP